VVCIPSTDYLLLLLLLAQNSRLPASHIVLHCLLLPLLC
jgi:hypothetical protein